MGQLDLTCRAPPCTSPIQLTHSARNRRPVTQPLNYAVKTRFQSSLCFQILLLYRYGLVSGKPIKFTGIGEKMDALEPFYPGGPVQVECS
jgi:hypothetical protein